MRDRLLNLLIIISMITLIGTPVIADEASIVWYTLDENNESIPNKEGETHSTPFYLRDDIVFPSSIGSDGIYQLIFHNSEESLSFISVWYGGGDFDDFLESNKDLGKHIYDGDWDPYALAPGEKLTATFQIPHCDVVNVKGLRDVDFLAVNETSGTLSLETRIIETGNSCDDDSNLFDWILKLSLVVLIIILMILIFMQLKWATNSKISEVD
ncbi:MAG: hypothetical protein ACW99A_06735 [Candidatus Kariarchaeaceae archaeon]|jgi:hypothetical protein